ncbi:hypothetical protein TIFTF001_027754 [Ficus carica]|uniref:Uncharacterized protein n=1 Tax=Ficus carica TaxID=3494 RepID=A0AA88DNM1_FICCA|nr:hypothetical protein TIFTF001_027754 [Ficus carica]
MGFKVGILEGGQGRDLGPRSRSGFGIMIGLGIWDGGLGFRSRVEVGIQDGIEDGGGVEFRTEAGVRFRHRGQGGDFGGDRCQVSRPELRSEFGSGIGDPDLRLVA